MPQPRYKQALIGNPSERARYDAGCRQDGGGPVKANNANWASTYPLSADKPTAVAKG